jgi:hypothetical protein
MSIPRTPTLSMYSARGLHSPNLPIVTVPLLVQGSSLLPHVPGRSNLRYGPFDWALPVNTSLMSSHHTSQGHPPTSSTTHFDISISRNKRISENNLPTAPPNASRPVVMSFSWTLGSCVRPPTTLNGQTRPQTGLSSPMTNSARV